MFMNGWPSVSFEEHDWVIKEPDLISRRQSVKHQGSYKAAVVPKIAEIKDVSFDNELVKLMEASSLAIAKFDQSNNSMMLPFSALILRSESAASSQIENLTASAKAIALAAMAT